MSNAAYLIATDRLGPAADDEVRLIGYTNRQIIAEGPCAVPVFWLALFGLHHRLPAEVTGDDDPVTVPSLVADRAEAMALLESRSAALRDVFPEFGSTLDLFVRLVGRPKRQFIKVHLQEIWDLDPEELEAQLEAGFRCFRSGHEDDFRELLMLASITNYDAGRRTIIADGGSVPRAFHLRGYARSDRDYDNTADI